MYYQRHRGYGNTAQQLDTKGEDYEARDRVYDLKMIFCLIIKKRK